MHKLRHRVVRKMRGPVRHGQRELIILGLAEQPDLGRPGVPGPSSQTCSSYGHMIALQAWVKNEWLTGQKSGSDLSLSTPILRT